MEKSSTLTDKEKWDAFQEVLELLIYGIILFQNIDDFIDMSSVFVFLTQNFAPTLLENIYYYLTLRYEKKGGTILCWARLLHKWFLSHMLKKGAFIENKVKLKWSQRVVSLIAKNDSWYFREYDKVEIVFSYGDFLNVPFI